MNEMLLMDCMQCRPYQEGAGRPRWCNPCRDVKSQQMCLMEIEQHIAVKGDLYYRLTNAENKTRGKIRGLRTLNNIRSKHK